jgi:hypothetical protein
MKYRAVFTDPADNTQERPVEILGNDFKTIERWRDKMLESATNPEAYVSIYETIETLRQTRKRKSHIEAKAAAKG